MDVDAKNRETIRDLSSKRQEPEDSAMDLMAVKWGADLDAYEDEMERRHEVRQERQRGQG